MQTKLTSKAMLAAAQKQLAAHLATRPATDTERDTIRQDLLSAAAECDRRVGLRYRPQTASEIGHGPDAVELQHVEGRLVAQSVLEGMRQQNLAMRYRMQADAWVGPSTAAWDRTRSELQARVDYYAGLVAEGR